MSLPNSPSRDADAEIPLMAHDLQLEHIGGICTSQTAYREQRRYRRHGQSGDKHGD